jgi:heme/copper-type cytochrome/quinol oxidase subunit 1
VSAAAYKQPERIAEIVVREPLDEARASWIERVRSADHKVIGTTLIGFSLIAVVLAGVTELLGWAQLFVPDNTFLTPERFYALHTLSDTSFLYLFALPLFAGLATFVLPLQIGARATAFPRLSALGAWMVVLGGAFLFFSLFFNQWLGGANMSVPLASTFYSPGPGADFWIIAAMMVAGGLACNAVDLAVTYSTLRADGMTGRQTPIFAYTTAVYAYGVLVTAPVLIAAGLMLLFERQWAVFGIFDPVNGGNALLWKTLFQWWAHSAPYLVTLMAIGVVSEIVPVAARTKLANREAVKRAIMFFALFGILSFGQVFFSSPVASGWNCTFMLFGLALLAPAAVIVTSWIRTLRAGSLLVSAHALFALSFIGFFVLGMIANTALSLPTLGRWLSGSEFGYAAWHDFVWASAATAGFGGLLYWFPKITGRQVEPAKARVAFSMISLGTLIAILSMASLGLDGFPREISEYGAGMGQARNIEAGLATLLASFGVLGLLINLIQSSARGTNAGNDPWHASTLEWFTPSPPPANNFDTIPAVSSEDPLNDIRARIAARSGTLAGSVAQPTTAGRPSSRPSGQ